MTYRFGNTIPVIIARSAEHTAGLGGEGQRRIVSRRKRGKKARGTPAEYYSTTTSNPNGIFTKSHFDVDTTLPTKPQPLPNHKKTRKSEVYANPSRYNTMHDGLTQQEKLLTCN